MKNILFILALLMTLNISSQGVLSGTATGTVKPLWGAVQPAGLVQRSNPLPDINPADIPNMAAWYDVTDVANTTVVSGKVTNLKDKSGNGRHMNLNYDAVHYPPYSASGGANNKAYMTISSTADLYTAAVSVSQPVTIYFVVKSNTFINTGYMLSGGGNVFFIQQFTQPIGNTVNMNAGSQYVRNANGYNTNWEVITSVFKNDTSKFQINNDPYELSKNSYGGGTAGGSPMSLIGFEPYYHNANFNISELIIYSGVVSNFNDSLVRRYLTLKYNPPTKNVLFGFGDSITWGAASTDKDTSSFMAYVCRDSGWQICNNGYPGTAVLTGVGSAPGFCLEDIYADYLRYNDFSKTRILFSYGTNDGTTDATWVTHYKAVIQKFIDIGVPRNHIIVCTMPARAPGGVAALSPPYNVTYTNTKQVADDLGVQFCDAITYSDGIYTSAWISGDGVHPTDLGHRMYANALEQVLQ